MNLEEGKQKIKLFEAYYQSEKEKLFIDQLTWKSILVFSAYTMFESGFS